MHFRAKTSQDLEALRRGNPALCRRIEKVLATELERAKTIIARHRDAVERIADALSVKGKLGGAEVAQMLEDNTGLGPTGSSDLG